MNLAQQPELRSLIARLLQEGPYQLAYQPVNNPSEYAMKVVLLELHKFGLLEGVLQELSF